MKTTLIIIGICLVLLWIGGIEIRFAPFKVSLKEWQTVCATVLLMMGGVWMACISYDKGRNDYKQQIQKTLQQLREQELQEKFENKGARMGDLNA